MVNGDCDGDSDSVVVNGDCDGDSVVRIWCSVSHLMGLLWKVGLTV